MDDHTSLIKGLIAKNNQHLSNVIEETIQDYITVLDGQDPINFYTVLISELEEPLLQALIEHTSFNQVNMAKILGISRLNLRTKLKKYGLLA